MRWSVAQSSFAAALGLVFAGCAASGGSGGGGPPPPRGDASAPDAAPLPDGAPPPRDATTPPADGSPTDAAVDARVDREAFCMGRGPVVTVGDSTTATETCAGSIATRVFDRAICTCQDANIIGYLRTRSFDSGMGTGEDESGAPVGINRNYLTGGYAEVGGSFVVGGAGGIDFGGYLEVGGDARFAGDIDAISYITIDRDLYVGGDVNLIGLVTVDRDLYHGGSLPSIPPPIVSGSTTRTSVTVPPPCACGADELVDIAAIVAAGRLENDNADVGLDPGLLESVIGLGEELTLPCGRYYLTSIGGLGDITLHVPGRTALFVDGDVNALGVMDIDLGPEGELDLFINGDLLSIGAGSYGDRSRPAATRIYVGGTGDVTLVGASGFVGNVYAPRARITAPGATTVYGSLFGREVNMPGYLQVSYDRAILDIGRDCPEPEMCGCGIGEGCPDRSACVGGACTACTSDSDCCGELVCHGDGSCGPLLI